MVTDGHVIRSTTLLLPAQHVECEDTVRVLEAKVEEFSRAFKESAKQGFPELATLTIVHFALVHHIQVEEEAKMIIVCTLVEIIRRATD